MVDTTYKMGAAQNVSLESAVADMRSSKKVEVVGNPNPASLEDALGMTEAQGRKAPVMSNPDRKVVFEDEGDDGEGKSSELVEILRELRQENGELRSERGKYGREVVGPLRQENEKMRAELDELKRQFQQGMPRAADSADYARNMFGPDVDVDDPEVQRATRQALSILDAAERGTQAYVSPIMQKLEDMERRLSGTQALSTSGLTLEEVQKAEEAYPELKDLPEAQRYSLLRRLSTAGKEAPPRDSSGRFLSNAARATARPEQHVEGGYGGGGLSDEDSADARAKWHGRMERFQAIGRTGKAGGGDRQKHLFLDMLQRGDFNG